MKKKYILIIVSVILIGMIVIVYAHNKQKKDHYIETLNCTQSSRQLNN